MARLPSDAVKDIYSNYLPNTRASYLLLNSLTEDALPSYMSADFWAGYISGAIGIVIGNPLDVIKVRTQAGRTLETASPKWSAQFETTSSLVRGAAAPILGYGALNALLFVAYNRTLILLDHSVVNPTDPSGTPLYKVWTAGAVGGLASWLVSAPTELVKCRAQLEPRRRTSSFSIAKDVWKAEGVRGLYLGGGVTSLRDSIGYGFYFWSYEICKRWSTSITKSNEATTISTLICGGVAGIVTWASVFPLDVIKTRLQGQFPVHLAELQRPETGTLLQSPSASGRQNAIAIARQAYREEGFQVFYRGLGVCSARAFVVNAVQWITYEYFMQVLRTS